MNTSLLIVLIDVVVVVISGTLRPPFHLLVSLLVILLVVAALNTVLYEEHLRKAILLNYGLLLINYVVINTFNGVGKDYESWGVVNLFFFMEFTLASLIMIVYCFVFESRTTNILLKSGSVVFYSMLASFSAFYVIENYVFAP
ncbi:MAG: hypothetical protein HY961_01045 [Ignavibacteriae bacterium]|nr:hypothetical protein [Ignavibacteriota bacterium]